MREERVGIPGGNYGGGGSGLLRRGVCWCRL